MNTNELFLKRKHQSIKDFKKDKTQRLYILATFFVIIVLCLIVRWEATSPPNLASFLLFCLPAYSVMIIVDMFFISKNIKEMLQTSDKEYLSEHEKFNIDKILIYKNGFAFKELMNSSFIVKKVDEQSLKVLLEEVKTKEMKEVSLNDLYWNYT